MFIIELTLKYTPLPLVVQRKTAEDAQATYDKIVAAMRSSNTEVLELTCDQQPEKRVGVISSEISAVQLFEKSSSSASGRTPGFFALAE